MMLAASVVLVELAVSVLLVVQTLGDAEVSERGLGSALVVGAGAWAERQVARVKSVGRRHGVKGWI
jgi:hypothetical protein